MGALLNLAYLVLGVLALPWLLWQRLKNGKYRDGWPERFLGRVPRRSGQAKCIWLHAVSVGEVNLLAPILARFERLHPDWECVISTTTQTGFALAQKRYAPRMVFFMPLDFTWAVRQAMRRIQPDLLVLSELELWPNLISAAKDCGAKVAIINGRLSERSFRGYRRLGWLLRQTLRNVDLIAVQTEDYARRFCALGAVERAVHVTGSVKFDGANTDRANASTMQLRNLAAISERDVVFLAGSTQQPEETLAVEIFRRVSADFPQLRLILVPRHPERFESVARLLDKSGLSWQRRSRLDAEGTPAPARVLLVDAVGELAAWWGTAQIAFVGGSLGNRGGQNMIEPAAYGAAVSFGPNTWNFRDVVSLLAANDAAVIVRNAAELETFVRNCLTDPDYARTIGARAQNLVLRQIGAADRTIQLLNQLTGPALVRGRAA